MFVKAGCGDDEKEGTGSQRGSINHARHAEKFLFLRAQGQSTERCLSLNCWWGKSSFEPPNPAIHVLQGFCDEIKAVAQIPAVRVAPLVGVRKVVFEIIFGGFKSGFHKH